MLLAMIPFSVATTSAITKIPPETTLPVIVQEIPTPTSPTQVAPTVSNNEDEKTITLYLLPSLAVVAIIFMMLW